MCEEYRRQGIGSALITEVITRMGKMDRQTATAMVKDSDLESQLFYSSIGFKADHCVRGYYDNDDGIVFQYARESLKHSEFLPWLVKQRLDGSVLKDNTTKVQKRRTE